MDDLTLLREFRAERAEPDLTARALAWRELEAKFDAASAAAAPATASSRGGFFGGRSRRGSAPRARHGPSHRRRLLAFAGATALAATLAGVLVLSSGPTAQPAAAEILHRTAEIAAAGDAPAAVPGPGQFFYRKFERLELQSWVPGGEGMMGGIMTRPGAFAALMPTSQEWWTGPDGSGRVREVAGTPRFLSEEEKRRWEAASSRLPAPFDPEYQDKYHLAFRDARELGRGVVDRDVGTLARFHFTDTSALPTDPLVLRRTIEEGRVNPGRFTLGDPAAKPLDGDETIAGLFNILTEGNPSSPALRAAVFNALAELPGIEVETEATDMLGRSGYGIRSLDRGEGGGLEYVFDPETSAVLAERAFLTEPGDYAFHRGLPAGLTIRETAFEGSGVVDSVEETGDQ